MRLAIIPARGGSKRIPRKNIRPFAGKPIIAYSIGAALESRLFDRVAVSTDDQEIAAVARDWGAETPFVRPPELSNDSCGTDDVVRHAIRWYAEAGQPCDHVCCIYATAPMLTASWITKGWEGLQKPGKRFAFGVTSYAFPIQRALRLTADGGVRMFQPEHAATHSQQLEPAYHDAGQFYWGDAHAFLDGLETFEPHSVAIVLPRWMVMDIDTPEDWVHAELLFEVANARAAEAP